MLATSGIMSQNNARSGIYPNPSNYEHGSSGGEDDTTLAGLKEIVSRQQKEIENHQQELVAKGQRLKFLKQPPNVQINDEAIRAMREKVNAQEQKLERLRELKGKVDQQRSLNISELESVKAHFREKEHELMEAVAKVEALSKQLDTVKKSHIVKGDSINITAEELVKLKSELKLTQEANEQKNHELAVQLNLLNQRNKQVEYLDKKIEELQTRVRKKKQAEQNSVAIHTQKVPVTNVATVEPSIRIEPIPSSVSNNVSKVPLIPNPNDPRYQTLPNNFKYTQNYYNQQSIYNVKMQSSKNDDKQMGHYNPQNLESKNQPRQMDDVQRQPMPPHPPMYNSNANNNNPPVQQSEQQPRPMYTSASHLPNRPQIAGYMGDTNNNNRRASPDYTKKDQPDSNYRPSSSTTPVNQPYKPIYASRSVIADTYMKRLGPKPMYKAMIPHSIPAFHLQNSIISDKVSSKNNTLRSLRRRHSYTETDEAKIEAALGPREVTPGAPTAPVTAQTPAPTRESPKLEPEKPLNTSNSSHNSSICSDEPKIPNSGIVARQILRRDIGVKRNFDRRVTFDPHALLLDASLEGEFDLVQRSATQVPDASLPNDEGITALHNAICAGHFDIVKFLVNFGVDVNSQDIDGWTPLHCASSCNNLPMVKFLVEHGACIYAQTISDHETPAEKCEDEDDDACARYLYGIQEKLGVLNGGTVYALFDQQASKADELSFKNGDKLTVLKMDQDEREWWWATNGEREGFIPRTFLGLFPRVQ